MLVVQSPLSTLVAMYIQLELIFHIETVWLLEDVRYITIMKIGQYQMASCNNERYICIRVCNRGHHEYEGFLYNHSVQLRPVTVCCARARLRAN